jgi:foldase protein PrsA
VLTTLALTSSLLLAEVTEIVLRVNERIATTYDYAKRRQERVRAISQAEDLSAERRQELIARVGEVIMADLLENLLLLSRADQLGLDVSEGEISEAVGRAKKGFGIETDAEFQQALAESGMTEQDFREQMRSSILVQQVMGREVQPRISLEEEDLRRYYQSHTEDFQIPERLRLREVVVVDSVDVSQDDMALLAEAIRQQVLSGREFEEVVGPYAEQGV